MTIARSQGKAAISAELSGIFDRLGTRAESWRVRLEKLRTGRLFGRFIAASRERLREVAGRLDVRRVAKLAGFPGLFYPYHVASAVQPALPV
ncbi:MAG: hypothetical protein ACHRXM_37220 [Isosphaerales bacterium]